LRSRTTSIQLESSFRFVKSTNTASDPSGAIENGLGPLKIAIDTGLGPLKIAIDTGLGAL
jgi:hypothetical protein